MLYIMRLHVLHVFVSKAVEGVLRRYLYFCTSKVQGAWVLASASELAAMLLHQTGNVKMLIIMTTARLSPPAERLLILAKMQRLTEPATCVSPARR
jgi:hypothetical protein